MPRVKRGTVRRAKRKKLLSRAKGFYQTKSKLYRAAKEAVDTAGKYAFVGRKNKKRDYRRLWVVRINAAARENGLTYSQLMRGLKAAGVTHRPQDAGRHGRHPVRSVRQGGGAGQGRAPRPGECLITPTHPSIEALRAAFRARLPSASTDRDLKALNDAFLEPAKRVA